MAAITINDQLYNQLTIRAEQIGISVKQLAEDVLFSINLSRESLSHSDYQKLF